MKKAIVALALIFTSSLALADYEWSIQECFAAASRGIGCDINGNEFFVNLDDSDTRISYKMVGNPADGIVSGFYILNFANGKVFINCDDGIDLKQVVYYPNGGAPRRVSCN